MSKKYLYIVTITRDEPYLGICQRVNYFQTRDGGLDYIAAQLEEDDRDYIRQHGIQEVEFTEER